MRQGAQMPLPYPSVRFAMTEAVAELVYLRDAKGGYEPQKRYLPYITASDKRIIVTRYPLTKDKAKSITALLMEIYPPPAPDAKGLKGLDVRGGAETSLGLGANQSRTQTSPSPLGNTDTQSPLTPVPTRTLPSIPG